MGSALKIRDNLTPLELRRWARVESYGRAAARAYGIANALEEMPRADAARLAGMDRQTLRDAVVRYNAKGLEGLHDRPKGYSPRRLTADEEAALAAVIIAGPEPERDGVCAWTRADLCRWLEERFAKTYHPSSMTRVLRRMGFSRQKARPEPPAKGRRSAGALQKRGLRDILKATAAAHPDKRLQLWFQDEARVGNKGRVCHRWWRRGERAPGTRQIGYQWAYIFSAVRPDTGDDVTLVMPSVNAKVMDLFLAHFADTLDQDAHAVMMCDGAGWHDERALTVPDNVTLALLPPYSPELNPVERVLALPTRTLPIAPRPRRHRGHHRRLLPSMDRPHRRTGSYANPLRLSMDHEGDFIGSLVLSNSALTLESWNTLTSNSWLIVMISFRSFSAICRSKPKSRSCRNSNVDRIC